MAQTKEKSGRQVANELAHTEKFLKLMGYETQDLSLEQAITIKRRLVKVLTQELGEPSEEPKNAF